MTRRTLAVVMDPIADIKYAKDTTLAMCLAAQAADYELLYLEQSDLWLRDGVALGRARSLQVFANPEHWFELGEPQTIRLGELDVILMRKDPPFDMEFVYTTYMLERAKEQGALVVNEPSGLRDMNEKVYTAWFPQCCAPTLVTRNMHDMEEFLAEHDKIVCKPLDGMGGRSIFVIERNDKNRRVILETLTHDGTRYAIAQRYIPDIVTSGDSRILLIDGEPIPFALARIPRGDDHRGNLAAGGKGVGRELNDRDRFLAAQIGPALAARGMLFVGIDVIGGYVTEINVTSPTGARELDRQFGIDVTAGFIAAVSRHLDRRA